MSHTPPTPISETTANAPFLVQQDDSSLTKHPLSRNSSDATTPTKSSLKNPIIFPRTSISKSLEDQSPKNATGSVSRGLEKKKLRREGSESQDRTSKSNEMDQERKARILSFGSDVTKELPFKGRPLSGVVVRQRLKQKIRAVDSEPSSPSHQGIAYSPPNSAPSGKRHRLSGAKKAISNYNDRFMPRSSQPASSVPTMKMIRINEQRSQTSLFGKMRVSSPRVKPRKVHSAVGSTRSYKLNNVGMSSNRDGLEISGLRRTRDDDCTGVQSTDPTTVGGIDVAPRQIQTADRATRRRIQMDSALSATSPNHFSATNLFDPMAATNMLNHDDSVRQAEKFIQDAYTFKSFHSTKSNWSEQIDLPSLGIRLLVDRKSQKYNLFRPHSSSAAIGARSAVSRRGRRPRDLVSATGERSRSRGPVHQLLEQADMQQSTEDSNVNEEIHNGGEIMESHEELHTEDHTMDEYIQESTEVRHETVQSRGSVKPWVKMETGASTPTIERPQLSAHGRNTLISVGEPFLLQLFGIAQ